MDKKYTLRVIDFETTGVPDDESKHSVVEAAYVDICPETKSRCHFFETLVMPETTMDIEALATHHITAEEANGLGIKWEDSQSKLTEIRDPKEVLIYVAHNAEFEKKFFNPEGVYWIDTYKVALKLYPDAPRHSNQVLKYYLKIKDSPDHHPPHRALPDCYVTSEILLKMMEEIRVSDMVKISKQPPYLTRIGFGKHRGKKFEDLPKGYLEWLLGQGDMREGVKEAAERALAA